VLAALKAAYRAACGGKALTAAARDADLDQGRDEGMAVSDRTKE
jgi:hypothetical protein